MIDHNNQLTIITGADSSFFRSLYQFLLSLIRHNGHDNNRVLIYDLGLTTAQRHTLNQKFLNHPEFELRRFPFEDYPDFVGLAYQSYAWKPIIISDVLEEVKGKVLWLDSATLILAPLTPVTSYLDQYGLYVPISGAGTLKEWTHPKTLAYLDVPLAWLKRRNRAGGVCAFNYHVPEIRELVGCWKRLALIKDCIKPEGANRTNHRDDQSLLTILLYQFQAKYHFQLPADEVDISSAQPVPFLSVRNNVSNTIPLSLDFFVRLYFLSKHRIDIWIQNFR